MGWRIVDGRMVKVGPTPIEITPPLPEVVKVARKAEPDEMVCDKCGREYKTVQGLANHIDSKH